MCSIYHIFRYAELAECKASVSHHDRVRLVCKHPVQKDGEDLPLHLYVDHGSDLTFYNVI